MPPKKKEVVEEKPIIIGRLGTNLKCGIVGLPNVGKSTFFNVLTKTQMAAAENFPFCTIDPNENKYLSISIRYMAFRMRVVWFWVIVRRGESNLIVFWSMTLAFFVKSFYYFSYLFHAIFTRAMTKRGRREFYYIHMKIFRDIDLHHNEVQLISR